MKRLGILKIIRSFGKRAMFYMPLMITCRQFEDFVIDYLDDKLPARQKMVFELHLKVCRECRDYLDAYKRATEVAVRVSKSSEQDEELPKVPDDFINAVLMARKQAK